MCGLCAKILKEENTKLRSRLRRYEKALRYIMQITECDCPPVYKQAGKHREGRSIFCYDEVYDEASNALSGGKRKTPA